jgi:glycerol 2-dehydrogenase (NADP+)
LAKSVTPSRIADNGNLIYLEPEELEALNAFVGTIASTKGFKRYVYPDFGVDLGFPDKPPKLEGP